MTREEAIECIEAIHVQMFNSGNSKWTKACDMAIEALNRPHGECKIYHARFEDRIACKCGFMQVITGHWDDYNYCQRCGRKALKEVE